jgi:hypothetical protein
MTSPGSYSWGLDKKEKIMSRVLIHYPIITIDNQGMGVLVEEYPVGSSFPHYPQADDESPEFDPPTVSALMFHE